MSTKDFDSFPYIVIGTAVAVLLIVFLAMAKLAPEKKPEETYSLVMTCDAPFMRRTKESILRRDSDGQLFYKDYMLKLTPIAGEANIKKICK